ncbi:hypothetical protein [Paracoccus sp. PAR01]|uniref:hypothetical protein n=1 Tax=Paracoccus sp. PAR01 TaxID=2769282 RepID=UPI00177EB2A5|nr:hypothetical protein [Paracoccus sp. PAR01]MBD9528979.1 hypothetical protein [Paracoccus sp. PAR01]
MRFRDGDWHLIDHQFETGRTVWAYFHGDGRITTRTDYPVDSLIKANAIEANANVGAKWGDGKIAARIPKNVFFEQLAPAIEQEDDKYVSRWLNDGDHAAFRTFGGRV